MKSKLILALLLCLTPSLAFGQARYETQFLKQLPAGGVAAYSGAAQVCLGAGLGITNVAVSSNVATLTMASNPLTAGFINSRDVLLFGFTGGDTFLNSSFTMTAVTSTSISFAVTHADISHASSGAGAVMKPSTAAGSACAPTTAVYLDQSLTTQLNNGMTFGDDGSGNVRFFAAPGTYWLSYSASAAQPYLQQITVPYVSGSLNLASPTITGTDTGAEIVQNKTLDVNLNSLIQTTPSAGKYLRDNGTKFVPSSVAAAGAGGCTSQFPRTLNDNAVPTCAAVNLASDVTGNLPVGNLNSGTGASSSTFWRGDGTWAAPAASTVTAMLVGGCNGTASAGSTLTLFGLGNFSGISCNQSGVAGSIPMPSSGTLKNLRVVAVTGGVNASSGVVTVMDGGVSTGITCTLGTGTTCNDTTHTASVSAGDLVLVQFTTQGAETLAGVRVTVEKQ